MSKKACKTKRVKKEKRNNIHQLIIKNYLAMVLTTVLICVALFIVSVSVINYFYNSSAIDSTFEFRKFKLEDFEDIDPTIIAPNGYYEVLDKDCNVIYSSSKVEKVNVYNAQLVDLVKDLRLVSYFENSSYLDENGEMEYFIKYRKRVYYEPNGDKNKKESIVFDDDGPYHERDFVVILDEHYTVKASNSLPLGMQLSEREFQYLSGEVDNFQVSKYNYTTQSDDARTVIVYHRGYITQSNQKIMQVLTILAFVLIIVAFVVDIVLFSRRITEKVKKPLDSINFAIDDIKKSGKTKSLDIYEPTEFSDLSHNFNEMSTKLEESRQAEKSLNGEKLKIIADISHDLKTPITAIMGYTRALSDGLIAQDDFQKYFNIIDEKADGLNSLINMFFDYCKMEYPNFALTCINVDICEYMRKYLAEKYEQCLNTMKVEFDIDIPEEKIECDIDEVQFKRAIENIVSNSIKHNNGNVKIAVKVAICDTKCAITIADNGKGIEKEVAEDIFKPFVVGDNSRTKNHGTGLGLSITKKIVEMHGGHIEYVAGQGEYSTIFSITLPLAETQKIN